MTNKDKLEKAKEVLIEEYYKETGCDLYTYTWRNLVENLGVFDSSVLVKVACRGIHNSIIIIEVDIGDDKVLLEFAGCYNSWSEEYSWESPPYLVRETQVTHTIFERI